MSQSLHLDFLATMLAGVVQQDMMSQTSAVFCQSTSLVNKSDGKWYSMILLPKK
jgi:hypothetical protein